MSIFYANLELDIQKFRVPPYASYRTSKGYIVLDWQQFWTTDVKKFEICMWCLIRYCSKLPQIRIRIIPDCYTNNPPLQSLCLGVPTEVVTSCRLEKIVVQSFTSLFPANVVEGFYMLGSKGDWLMGGMARCFVTGAW